MGDSTDPTINPQAQRPGEVEPQRTPGTAPSVVPLPDGADPDAEPGTHPLPEQAIAGYPKVADLYAEAGDEPAPQQDPAPVAEKPAEEKPASKTAGGKPAK